MIVSPAGNVYVVENYTVFISGESSATGKYSRREGRRVLLRAVDDVERRFSEPVFSRSSASRVLRLTCGVLLMPHRAQC